MGSLTLRPGDLLTLLARVLSIGFIGFVSSTDAIQAKGILTSSPVGLAPTEHARLCWTHCLLNIPSGLLSRHLWYWEPGRLWAINLRFFNSDLVWPNAPVLQVNGKSCGCQSPSERVSGSCST